MPLDVRIRERLLRDCIARCVHDWGHAIQAADVALAEVIHKSNTRARKRDLSNADTARLGLKSVHAEMVDLWEGVRSLTVSGETERFGQSFRFGQLVSDSFFPFRSSLKRDGVTVDEKYSDDVDVVGPEEDFGSILEALFELVAESLIPKSSGSKNSRDGYLAIYVQPFETDGILPGSSLSHQATASRIRSRRNGKIRFGECLVSWSGKPLSLANSASTLTRAQRPPLSNFVLLAAHNLATAVGGNFESRRTEKNMNFVAIRLPAL